MMDRKKRALLLVDHGSVKDEANDLLAEVTAHIQRRLESAGEDAPFDFAECCHMELAPPTIADGIARCIERGAGEVVVMPYFLAPGRHSQQDIPRMTAEAAAAHPGLRFTVAPPLGLHEKLLDVALERAGVGLQAGLREVPASQDLAASHDGKG